MIVIRRISRSLPRWLRRRRRAFRRPASQCIAANTSPGSPHRSPERSTKLRTLVGLKPDNGHAQRSQRTLAFVPPSFDRGPPCPTGLRLSASRPEIPPRHAASAVQPDWMPDGDKPFLFMTFGTVAGRSERVRNAYRVLLEAVGSLPVKALLTTGPVMPREELGVIPDNVRVEKFVPQVETMPYTSAVVCHGGSGTLISTLATGCPVVVIPLFADQPANARAAGAAGAGLAVFTHHADEVARAILAVLTSESIRAGAQKISGRTGLHAPDGRGDRRNRFNSREVI